MSKKAEGHKKADRHTVPVTMRALLQRINRKIREGDQVLKVTRGERAWVDYGDFYILNSRRNSVTRDHVDPEELGREIGVLRPWEQVVKEESR
jgi:hypothetical protein